MAVSLFGVPFKLTPQDMGAFDSNAALKGGIANALAGMQASAYRQKMPYDIQAAKEDLQSKIYENMIKKPKAEMAPQITKAEYDKLLAEAPEIRARTGLMGEQTKELEYKRTHGGYDPEVIQSLRALPQIAGQGNQVTGGGSMGSTPTTPLGTQNPVGGGMTPIQPSLPESLSAMLQDHPAVQAMRNGMTQIPQQQPMQQNQAPAQLAQQQDQMIPGTNISMQKAREAIISKYLGIPMENPSTEAYQQERIKVAEANLAGDAWKSLPAAAKTENLAQAKAFGIPDPEKQFMAGKSLKDMAQEYVAKHPNSGVDPEDMRTWPVKEYAPTTATKTNLQRANIARGAFDAINPWVTDALAPFQGSWDGHSPKLLMDQVTGENKDQVAKAMAAAFVSNELNGLNARAFGITTVGIGMLRSLAERSKTDIKASDLFMDADTFRKFRSYVQQAGNIVNNAENNVGWAQYRQQAGQQEAVSDAMNSNSDMSSMSDEELKRIAGG